MHTDAMTQKLRTIKASHKLSFEAIGRLLGLTPTYIREMHNGRMKTHPRTVRLLELELAEQKRVRRRRA